MMKVDINYSCQTNKFDGPSQNQSDHKVVFYKNGIALSIRLLYYTRRTDKAVFYKNLLEIYGAKLCFTTSTIFILCLLL